MNECFDVCEKANVDVYDVMGEYLQKTVIDSIINQLKCSFGSELNWKNAFSFSLSYRDSITNFVESSFKIFIRLKECYILTDFFYKLDSTVVVGKA